MKLCSKFIWLLVGGTLATAATFVGCQSTDYPTPQPSTTGYNTTSTRVLFVNATPDANSLNFLVENASAGTITPGTSTSYVGVPLGSAQIRIQGAGGTLGTASPAGDISSKPSLLANASYTIFATDTINRPKVVSATGATTDVGGVRTLTVVDTLTAPAAGTAKFRFFNLSPDVTGVASSTVAGPVSARLLNASGASVTTLANRAYRNIAGANLRYTVVPAGTYTVQVYAGATVPTSLTAAPLASATVSMGDGKIYTLYSRGLRRNRTLSVGVVQHN